jgi:hypothetical protein
MLEDDASLIVDVTDSDAADPLLLQAPSLRRFGGAPDIATKRIQFRIGRRPIARDIGAMYQELGGAAKFDLHMSYRVWLIVQSVGIIRYEGFEDVRFLGCEVRFPEKPRVTIAGLAPQTHFVSRLTGDVGVDLEARAEVTATGDIAVPSELSDLVAPSVAFANIEGSAGAKFRASAHANVVGELSVSVMTPIVTTVGIGDHRAEWLFRKHKKPLNGDHFMVLTVIAPKNVEELRFETRVSGVVSVFELVSTSLTSGWIPLTCSLVPPSPVA